jgi:hypothetical protein
MMRSLMAVLIVLGASNMANALSAKFQQYIERCNNRAISMPIGRALATTKALFGLNMDFGRSPREQEALGRH